MGIDTFHMGSFTAYKSPLLPSAILLPGTAVTFLCSMAALAEAHCVLAVFSLASFPLSHGSFNVALTIFPFILNSSVSVSSAVWFQSLQLYG